MRTGRISDVLGVLLAVALSLCGKRVRANMITVSLDTTGMIVRHFGFVDAALGGLK
jgi:hypothetical protein